MTIVVLCWALLTDYTQILKFTRKFRKIGKNYDSLGTEFTKIFIFFKYKISRPGNRFYKNFDFCFAGPSEPILLKFEFFKNCEK